LLEVFASHILIIHPHHQVIKLRHEVRSEWLRRTQGFDDLITIATGQFSSDFGLR
jgi:hypothetical protein